MKITKAQLTQIIKEELTAVMTNEIYLPLVGGKLPENDYLVIKKKVRNMEDILEDMVRSGDLEQSDFEQWGSRMEVLLKELFELVNTRHGKEDAEWAMSQVEKQLRLGTQFAEQGKNKRLDHEADQEQARQFRQAHGGAVKAHKKNTRGW